MRGGNMVMRRKQFSENLEFSDIKIGWYALFLCILKEYTSEQAFMILAPINPEPSPSSRTNRKKFSEQEFRETALTIIHLRDVEKNTGMKLGRNYHWSHPPPFRYIKGIKRTIRMGLKQYDSRNGTDGGYHPGNTN
jgi:hypothetical protein